MVERRPSTGARRRWSGSAAHSPRADARRRATCGPEQPDTERAHMSLARLIHVVASGDAIRAQWRVVMCGVINAQPAHGPSASASRNMTNEHFPAVRHTRLDDRPTNHCHQTLRICRWRLLQQDHAGDDKPRRTRAHSTALQPVDSRRPFLASGSVM